MTQSPHICRIFASYLPHIWSHLIILCYLWSFCSYWWSFLYMFWSFLYMFWLFLYILKDECSYLIILSDECLTKCAHKKYEAKKRVWGQKHVQKCLTPHKASFGNSQYEHSSSDYDQHMRCIWSKYEVITPPKAS